MKCELCKHLQTNKKNSTQPDFFCTKAKRAIKQPWIEQSWCPKKTKQKKIKKYDQDFTLQTNHLEMKLIQKIADKGNIKTLQGYLQGLNSRSKQKTTFNIPIIRAFIKEKIANLEKQNGKTS